MPVTKLTINRPNWLHNIPSEETSLLLRSHDQKMCCIGFYGLACGLTKDEITGVSEPHQLPLDGVRELPEEMLWLAYEDPISSWRSSDEAFDLMNINDMENYSDYQAIREETIAGIFAKHGVTVTFTDEPLPT